MDLVTELVEVLAVDVVSTDCAVDETLKTVVVVNGVVDSEEVLGVGVVCAVEESQKTIVAFNGVVDSFVVLIVVIEVLSTIVDVVGPGQESALTNVAFKNAIAVFSAVTLGAATLLSKQATPR